MHAGVRAAAVDKQATDCFCLKDANGEKRCSPENCDSGKHNLLNTTFKGWDCMLVHINCIIDVLEPGPIPVQYTAPMLCFHFHYLYKLLMIASVVFCSNCIHSQNAKSVCQMAVVLVIHAWSFIYNYGMCSM